jgi:hypothetical protein
LATTESIVPSPDGSECIAWFNDCSA